MNNNKITNLNGLGSSFFAKTFALNNSINLMKMRINLFDKLIFFKFDLSMIN